MKSIALPFLFLSISLQATTGNFEWQSKIGSVPQNGFYKIILSPEIVADLKSDHSDVRIYNSKNIEIPYILREEVPSTEKSIFKEYTILENKYLPKKSITRVVIHNAEKKVISSFCLLVRNADAEKFITLRGSDDTKNWFIIKSNYPVHSERSTEETSEIRTFDFPKSNYEYFELSLNDKWKDPLKIVRVGYYEHELYKGRYSEIPIQSIEQKDSSQIKRSFLKIKLNKAYEIDRLIFLVKSPDLYYRNCEIGRYMNVHKKSYFENFASFFLSSSLGPILELDKMKTSEFSVIIENDDNLPLKIDSIKAFQLNKYLIVKLTKKEYYTLNYGNKQIVAPEYDLKYFTNNIPSEIPSLSADKPMPIRKVGLLPHSVIFNKSFIWIVIVPIIITLAFFTIKLTKELNRKTD